MSLLDKAGLTKLEESHGWRTIAKRLAGREGSPRTAVVKLSDLGPNLDMSPSRQFPTMTIKKSLSGVYRVLKNEDIVFQGEDYEKALKIFNQ